MAIKTIVTNGKKKQRNCLEIDTILRTGRNAGGKQFLFQKKADQCGCHLPHGGWRYARSSCLDKKRWPAFSCTGAFMASAPSGLCRPMRPAPQQKTRKMTQPKRPQAGRRARALEFSASPPNQQVTKDPPQKNRQPVGNCRVRAQARLSQVSPPGLLPHTVRQFHL